LTPTVGLSDFTDRPTETPAVNKHQNNAHAIKDSTQKQSAKH